jgi:hypothetical protein
MQDGDRHKPSPRTRTWSKGGKPVPQTSWSIASRASLAANIDLLRKPLYQLAHVHNQPSPTLPYHTPVQTASKPFENPFYRKNNTLTPPRATFSPHRPPRSLLTVVNATPSVYPLSHPLTPLPPAPRPDRFSDYPITHHRSAIHVPHPPTNPRQNLSGLDCQAPDDASAGHSSSVTRCSGRKADRGMRRSVSGAGL